ncbi:hypothetical protein TNCV_3602881 [Trichonephila clavipes]|nr:hypothetical protein TNCV_3602881 [Trichonephila clavipes]
MGDEPHHFDAWSSDEDDMSPNFHITPMVGSLSLDIFRHPLLGRSSVDYARTYETPVSNLLPWLPRPLNMGVKSSGCYLDRCFVFS